MQARHNDQMRSHYAISTLIRNLPDMSALAVEWNELLANSASHVPFLRNEYLSTWWQTLGGGEWPQGELCVITARQDGRLAGIAPLFFTTNREGDPALMLLGCIEISDYLDLIAPAQTLQPFVDGLFDYLERDADSCLACAGLVEFPEHFPHPAGVGGRRGTAWLELYA